jgi:hypothetical protein
MTCLYEPQEMQKVEKVIARAKCIDLGLNEHFQVQYTMDHMHWEG